MSVLLGGAALAQSMSATVPGATQFCERQTEQLLNCARLGFSYKVPFGWVDRTDEMQGESGAAPGNSSPAANPSPTNAPAGSSVTLLAAFERPPGTAGGIDPAAIIAAESLANYPKIKTPADYLGPLADIAERRGLKMEGEPYEFSLGAKKLARADFTAGTGDTTVRQTSLVTIEKGYIVSFTFVSASEDQIDELIDGLSFARRRPVRPSRAK